MIDHHRRSQDCFEGAIISYIEPYASSASEMVTEMLPFMVDNPKIKQIEAEALLAGICVDTKNFYFKTGVRTFEAASFHLNKISPFSSSCHINRLKVPASFLGYVIVVLFFNLKCKKHVLQSVMCAPA